MFRGIRAKGFERGKNNEDGGPAMPERKWEMDENLVEFTRWNMELLDYVVDVLTSTLSGAACEKFFATQPTVTAELTRSARMNAICLMLASVQVCHEDRMNPRTDDIVMRGPKIHINGIENSQESETPGYSVDNDPFTLRGELVENRAQQEEMNQ